MRAKAFGMETEVEEEVSGTGMELWVSGWEMMVVVVFGLRMGRLVFGTVSGKVEARQWSI